MSGQQLVHMGMRHYAVTRNTAARCGIRTADALRTMEIGRVTCPTCIANEINYYKWHIANAQSQLTLWVERQGVMG